MECAFREMDEDEVPFFDGMSVCGGVLALATEKFAAYEASVDVRRGLEGHGAGVFEVEVECGAVDGVEVWADYTIGVVVLGRCHGCTRTRFLVLYCFDSYHPSEPDRQGVSP